jgi:pilus assembly protein CpaE
MDAKMVNAMASNPVVSPEQGPLRAVTVSRDVQEFDLLIEDMSSELGDAWGDLTFAEAEVFFEQGKAQTLELAVFAVDRIDEPGLDRVGAVIAQARAAGLRAILVAEGLGPVPMHALLRAGVDDFVPYPLPGGALSKAMARVRVVDSRKDPDIFRPAEGVIEPGRSLRELPRQTSEPGALFAFQGVSGGSGATTIAVNLAWELANGPGPGPALRICLLDLGLQFGSVATYLDLNRKPLIQDLLTDVSTMDQQAFLSATTSFRDKLWVMTSPAEVLPLDLIGPTEIAGVLELARATFDIVIVDMPNTLTGWTDTVISQADMYYLICELEVRSAQNALRFNRLLQSEGISTDRIQYVLNRAPGWLDSGGRGRIHKMAESLGIRFQAILPDGGKAVREANDQAEPLREAQRRNPLTKAIARMAHDIAEAHARIAAGEGTPFERKKRGPIGLSFG